MTLWERKGNPCVVKRKEINGKERTGKGSNGNYCELIGLGEI
jgi:hypothetical protein